MPETKLEIVRQNNLKHRLFFLHKSKCFMTNKIKIERMSTVSKKTLKLTRMSEIEEQEVKWLWYPYIPFGKITIIHGDPGEGKTTFALRLASACTTGTPLPGMDYSEPFNVIYQTAEDGLADTIKPRLKDAGANQLKVININEDDCPLTLLDERIEEAIKLTEAKLIILDPIQGYIGEKTDINRANEVRTVLKKIASVAERTGCAVVLIGHLNKSQGSSSAYRGLGSIDFRAAARSVLLIGRLKKEPNVRVIIHDKSSLAAEGETMAFNLGNEEGFKWLEGYESVTAEELLSGYSDETKTAKAGGLIVSILTEKGDVPSEEIFKIAEAKGISRRTVNEAKKKIPDIKSHRVGKHWNWCLKSQDCNIAECTDCIVD